MSMVRLLTAGKCLVGLKDSTARYRMANAKSLPKFESTKNPFRATTRAPLAEAQQTLLLAPDPEPLAEAAQPKPSSIQLPAPAQAPSVQKPVPISTPPVRKPQAQNGSGPGGETKSAVAKASVQTRSASGLIGRWTAALTGMFGKSRPARPVGMVKRGAARAVQGELSLDNIKVCCNDLSDSDVEVVAVPLVPPRAKARAAVGAVGVE
jgi:hypothetical protein